MTSETNSTPSNANSVTGTGDAKVKPIAKKVIQKAGGRHLVFRIKRGPWWFLPKPYALISNIEGSILFFYGIGQIWVTHKKERRINDWMLRVPRFISKRINWLVNELQPEIVKFIDQIQEVEIIGTLIIERRVVEFHWTVPRQQRHASVPDEDRVQIINDAFNRLAKEFAKLQLTGKEGQHDVDDDQIALKGQQVQVKA